MRPNIACRSFFRTSSVSSTSLSAMLLNASPSCLKLVACDVIVTRSSSRPSATACVPRMSAKIGWMNDRPKK